MRTMLSLAALSLGAMSMAQTFFDDFNRANGPLGANWQAINGSDSILNNAVAGTAANGLTLVSASAFTGAYNQTTVSADVRVLDQSATLTYAALSLGSDATIT